MAGREVHDIILEQISELRADIKTIHTPLNCPVTAEVKDQDKRLHALERREAWRAGALGAIGVIVGTGLSLFGKELVRLLRIP